MFLREVAGSILAVGSTSPHLRLTAIKYLLETGARLVNSVSDK